MVNTCNFIAIHFQSIMHSKTEEEEMLGVAGDAKAVQGKLGEK